MPSQRVHARLLARAVELQNRLADQGVLLRRQPARSFPRTASRGQQRTGDGRFAELLDQRIESRPSDPELPAGVSNDAGFERSGGDQWADRFRTRHRDAPERVISAELVDPLRHAVHLLRVKNSSE